MSKFAYKYNALSYFLETLHRLKIMQIYTIPKYGVEEDLNLMASYIDRMLENKPNRMEKYENR